MSLDVYLLMPRASHSEHENSWERRVCCTEHKPDGDDPGGLCAWCIHCEAWFRPHLIDAGCPKSIRVYDANITHNLGAMAKEAGVYFHLWRPEEIGIDTARQLIKPLQGAVRMMQADPARFEKHNASNGWGLYRDFVPFVSQYASACEEFPDAKISVSR